MKMMNGIRAYPQLIIKWCFFIGISGVTSTAMGKMQLFSEVKGVVLQADKPVVGAIVRQICHWHWTDEKIKSETNTDSKGEFHFPEIVGKSFLGRFLPHEPVVDQKILIEYQGKTFDAWIHFRYSYEPLSELAGQSIFLVCELNMNPSRKGPNNDIFGICQFKP